MTDLPGRSGEYMAFAHVGAHSAEEADPDPLLAAWTRAAAGLSPLFAIAEGELPGAAIAWIRRDPAHTHPRMVVLAREVLSDDLFSDAWNLLCLDEAFVPEIDGPRVLVVSRAGRIDAPAVPGSDWPAGYHVRTGTTGGEVVSWLLSRMPAETLVLAEAGHVRVLMFPTRPPIHTASG